MEDKELLNPFQIERLPELAIRIVAEYLNTRDLAACCATSYKMRELFNNDIIWRTRCIKPVAEYLMNTPCQVQPSFQSLEAENSTHSTLPPICKWRKTFMAEHHLWNNWRLGKYTKKTLIHVLYEHFPGVFCMFYSNDIAIVTSENMVVLVDVAKCPVEYATEPIVMYNASTDWIPADDDMLVTVCYLCVQVYHLDFLNKKNTLKHKFVVSETENDFHDEPKTMRYIVTGSYFVCIIKGQSTMHIWNFKTGDKVKEVVCPHSDKGIAIRYMTASGSNLVLAFENDNNFNVVLVYDLSKLLFNPFMTSFYKDPSRVWYFGIESIVAVLTFDEDDDSDEETVTITAYNYQSHDRLYTLPASDMRNGEIMGNCVIFTKRSYFNENDEVKSFNLLSGVTVTLMTNIFECHVLSDNFFIVLENIEMGTYNFKICDVSEHRVVEVNALSEECNNIDLFFNSLFNKAFSRFILQNNCTLFDFW